MMFEFLQFSHAHISCLFERYSAFSNFFVSTNRLLLSTNDARKSENLRCLRRRRRIAVSAALALGSVVEAWEDRPVKQHILQEFRSSGSRIVKTSLFFAALGGTFHFTQKTAQNIRGADDLWNQGIAGGVTGALFGLRGKHRGALSIRSLCCFVLSDWFSNRSSRPRLDSTRRYARFGARNVGVVFWRFWKSNATAERKQTSLKLLIGSSTQLFSLSLIPHYSQRPNSSCSRSVRLSFRLRYRLLSLFLCVIIFTAITAVATIIVVIAIVVIIIIAHPFRRRRGRRRFEFDFERLENCSQRLWQRSFL